MFKDALPEYDALSRLVYPEGTLLCFPNILEFSNLLEKGGQEIPTLSDNRYKLLTKNSFSKIEEIVGLCQYVSCCFERPMGLSALKALDKTDSKIFFEKGYESIPNAFIMTREFFCPDDTKIIYIDIAGTLASQRGKNAFARIGKVALDHILETSDHTRPIIVTSRTQNPMLVSGVTKLLSKDSLIPFFKQVDVDMARYLNWMVNTGKISRNTRSDTSFDAKKSLINWGAYGRTGDGTTWENMIKEYPDINWGTKVGKKMLEYLDKNNSSLEEILTKGHAFIIAAYLNR